MICILDLKKSTAQVRIDHPSQTSVRTVMNEEELQEVYEILRKRNVKPNTTTWNRRYRGYIQNINSGIPKKSRQFCVTSITQCKNHFHLAKAKSILTQKNSLLKKGPIQRSFLFWKIS